MLRPVIWSFTLQDIDVFVALMQIIWGGKPFFFFFFIFFASLKKKKKKRRKQTERKEKMVPEAE